MLWTWESGAQVLLSERESECRSTDGSRWSMNSAYSDLSASSASDFNIKWLPSLLGRRCKRRPARLARMFRFRCVQRCPCCATALAVRGGLPSPSWRSAHISSARAPSSAFARVSKCYSTPIGVNPPKLNQSVARSAPAAPPNLPPPRPTGARQWADIAQRRAAEGRAARRAGRRRPPSLRNQSVACSRSAAAALYRRPTSPCAARSAGRRRYLSLRKQSVARRAPQNLPPLRPTCARHWAKV
jgi:hypothetical protein